MTKYFKKKTECDSFDKIAYGCYDESDITHEGDIICRNVIEFMRDNFTHKYSLDFVCDYIEEDEITFIEEKEYKAVLKDAEHLAKQNELIIKKYL